jgi:aryl-alcohol dehydrogenase
LWTSSSFIGYSTASHLSLVAVLSFDHCGHCRQCLRGGPYRCLNFAAANFSGARPDGSRTLHDGAAPVGGSFFGQSSFADHCIATGRNAVKVHVIP